MVCSMRSGPSEETPCHPQPAPRPSAPRPRRAGTVELDALPAEGQVAEVTAAGDLTIHGVAQAVDVPLQVTMTGDTAVVTGSLDVTFADYDVTVPTAPIVLGVDESGTVELQLFLTQS